MAALRLTAGARRSVQATCIVLASLLVLMCGDSSHWYPKGETEVLSFREQPAETSISCTVSYRIRNVGSVEIASSTVSIKLSTDLQSYYATFTDETVIPPGRSITGNIQIVYDSPYETTTLENIHIEDCFFR